MNKKQEKLNKMTKAQLTQIIREELKMAKKPKSKLNEINWDVLGPALGVTVPGITAAFAAIKASISGAKKELAGKINPETGKPYTDEEIKAGVLRGLVDQMQKYGDN